MAFFWSDESVVQAGALTEIEIPPPQPPATENGIQLIRGIISFFHRDKPGQIQIFTRGAIAGVEGTEFVMAVDDAEETTLSVIEGLALKGFLFAAENQPRAAISWFGQALGVDSALGNAWLGRGLCRIQLGDANGGRKDLLMAAALEPQRAVLRSYLGKAD
ncbi:MAG: FecR domain-containing protein, partial [Verrucomicrobiota bacterium]